MKVAVNGASGAMGRLVIGLIAASDDMQLAAALVRAHHRDLGADAGMLAGAGRLGMPLAAELSVKPDVLIDFSSPQAALARARECVKAAIRLVIGTTGFSPEARKEVAEQIASRVPVLLAANMSLGEDVLLYGREGLVGARTSEEIAIHAVRGGDIVADHTVIFAAEGERIELTHRASSRDVFARGALQAAHFIVKQRPGLYSMHDVLTTKQP